MFSSQILTSIENNAGKKKDIYLKLLMDISHALHWMVDDATASYVLFHQQRHNKYVSKFDKELGEYDFEEMFFFGFFS